MENNTFTVLPMSQRFSLVPGKTIEGSIKIVNPADAAGDFHYKTSIMPYGVVGNEYTADLSTETGYTAITKWIKIDEPTGKVAPNETKEIKFTITVPEDAPAGGQYAAIAVSSDESTAASDGVTVQNIFELASVVYAEVAGETRREGEVIENNIPGFVMTPPVKVSALISNRGNIHEDATIVLKVSDFFTGRVILPTEENKGEYSEIVMPGTERYTEREIDNLPALGVFKVSQTIYYEGVASEEEREIIICPIWFMALVILTIVTLIITIVQIIKRHRKNRSLKHIEA